MTLRLGVIGLSPGNGHPYSWSAIFNGYNSSAMEGCGFPGIPRYLEKQNFPEDGIQGAQVTHIWTQDLALSKKVAQASLIPHIVNHYTDLIGQVEAVLLARDDAENHVQFASPFLKAGMPIYIDKPLALTLAHAKTLLSLQQYPGQLFSCSALRYAPELQLSPVDRQRVGDIRYVHATVPKDWNKYAIHIIDPVLNILGDQGTFSTPQITRSKHITSLHALHESGAQVHLSVMGDTPVPIVIDIAGSNGCVQLQFQNTFMAFKNALADFVAGIAEKSIKTSTDQVLRSIYLLEAGELQ
ncbi:Gfo/Idh/MocA family oxidoreductase [Limnohabitans sp. DM1]|uniref:Gfo/Idh/MocA family oxidoreductase n=1 Tax=Limnohabitans sp. DM1 TaxID=1597955 RepID=UPI000B7CAA15|nr:Gfo/Idh/MocA family oxidoreductase [Limnohabitans sp. DM1]